MFDSFIPRRPTFGISLTEYNERRHGNQRVVIQSQENYHSTSLPVRAIDGLGGFLMAILNTAKDWQDTLQSRLPGYAERIVEIRLDRTEGGMNLNMSKDTIDALAMRGEEAGETLLREFSFNEHRWRRTLSFLTKMEEGLARLALAYDRKVDEMPPGAKLLRDILTGYSPLGYNELEPTRRAEMARFARLLAAMGRRAARKNKAPGASGQVYPRIDARIRMIADADFVADPTRPV